MEWAVIGVGALLYAGSSRVTRGAGATVATPVPKAAEPDAAVRVRQAAEEAARLAKAVKDLYESFSK